MKSTGLALCACSNPKAVTEANFRGALKPVVASLYCRPFTVEMMEANDSQTPPPWPLMIPAKQIARNAPNDASERAMLDQSVRQGLLSLVVVETPVKLVRSGYPITRQKILSYSPTAKGQTNFRTIERKVYSGTYLFPGICWASGEITKIIRWTHPQPVFGVTASRVTYHYHGTDIDPSVPPDHRATIAAPVETTSILTLANDGWHPGTGLFR